MYMILKRKDEWVDYGRLEKGDPELYKFCETEERFEEVIGWVTDQKINKGALKSGKMIEIEGYSDCTYFIVKIG